MARPQSQPEKRSLLARATIEREQEQEPEITSCVASIIRAFTQSFDIFRRLRERRRRRRKSKKSRGKDGKEDGASAAELRLSQSLRRGPQHIGGVYEKGIKEKGREFEKGDAIAHTSLASTLLKLNTGLVNIIAAFLHPNGIADSASDLDLDYKSLTSLSETVRTEAVASLNQLYYRVSQSTVTVGRQPVSVREGDQLIETRRDIHAFNSVGNHQRSTKLGNPISEKQKNHQSRPSLKSRSSASSASTQLSAPTTIIARVPLKSTSQTQLVVIRPRTHNRKTSSSSNSSQTPSSPPTSPLSEHETVAQSPLPNQRRRHRPPKSTNPSSKMSQLQSPQTILTTSTRPDTWPPNPSTIPSNPSPLPSFGHPRRRSDKLTPSSYTFLTDSTQLGEIPQRKWTQPWDSEEAARLNREAFENWDVQIVDSGEGAKDGKRKKWRIGGMFRKGKVE